MTTNDQLTYAARMTHPATDRPYTPEAARHALTSLGFDYIGPIGDLHGYYLIGSPHLTSSASATWNASTSFHGHSIHQRQLEEDSLSSHDHIQWFQAQTVSPRHLREWTFNDPMYPCQWHLHGEPLFGESAHQDVNVLPAWYARVNGSGVNVMVLDDGVDYNHPDLLPNWRADASYNFIARTNSPLPGQGETHGTRCAGQIAAVSNNSVCGVGVAPGATISGARLIATSNTDAVEASALTFQSQINYIYSSSWGPSDDGASLDGPGYLTRLAMERGTSDGRHGRGSIFVFASAIGAIGSNGKKPDYGETCAAQLIVSLSGGSSTGITTTDVNNGCTNQHSGTSAAAPLVSGAIALMLSANPRLHWRDVQQILLETAKPTDSKDSSWHINGAGRAVSHKYGFGKLDASAAVFAAMNWTSMPMPQLSFSRPAYPNRIIHAGDSLNEFIDVTKSDVARTGISSLERIQVTVRIEHPIRGKLMILLTSPAKTVSVLAPLRANDVSSDGFQSWTFSTVHSWGESALGVWQLTVADTRPSDETNTGLFVSWQITLRGRCSDADTTLMDSGYRRCNVVIKQEVAHAQYLSIWIGCGILALSFVTLCGTLYIYRRPGKPYSALSSGTTKSSNLSKFWWMGTNYPDQNSYERVDVESPFISTTSFFPLDALPLQHIEAIPATPIPSLSSYTPAPEYPATASAVASAFAVPPPLLSDAYPPLINETNRLNNNLNASNGEEDVNAIRLLSPDSKLHPAMLAFIESSHHGGVGGGLIKSWSRTSLLSRFSNNSSSDDLFGDVERDRGRDTLTQQLSRSASSCKESSPSRDVTADRTTDGEVYRHIRLSLPPSRPSMTATGRSNRPINLAKSE
ncbi:hypothetical protein SeMB42_g01411 [Synchytrium endobioticum]|uniref:P/Homo B domain-containing protein n=1 Tax=Synchytrium endobioticum TaxID=286115 RepID=A0A507DMM0_9FUNG|nr:hypothetical protein SeMB42_g01411 [Synchytrium endobioticum]